jgi:hypothetical protein
VFVVDVSSSSRILSLCYLPRTKAAAGKFEKSGFALGALCSSMEYEWGYSQVFVRPDMKSSPHDVIPWKNIFLQASPSLQGGHTEWAARCDSRLDARRRPVDTLNTPTGQSMDSVVMLLFQSTVYMSMICCCRTDHYKLNTKY